MSDEYSNSGEGVYTVLVLVAVIALAVGVGVAWWGNTTLTEGEQSGGFANPFYVVD